MRDFDTVHKDAERICGRHELRHRIGSGDGRSPARVADGECVVAVRQPEIEVAAGVGVEVARAVARQTGDFDWGAGRAEGDDDGVQDAPGGVVRQIGHGAVALREARPFIVEMREHDISARDDDRVVVDGCPGVGHAVADVGAEYAPVLVAAAGEYGAAGDFDAAVGAFAGHDEGAADTGGGLAVFRPAVGIDSAASDADRSGLAAATCADGGGAALAVSRAVMSLDDAAGDGDGTGPLVVAVVSANARAGAAADREEFRVCRRVRNGEAGAVRDVERCPGGS